MKPGIVLCIGTREEKDRICRWIKANGANPNRIPEWARIIITGNRMIVSECIFDQLPSGGSRARIDRRGGYTKLATRQKAYRIRYDLKDIE